MVSVFSLQAVQDHPVLLLFAIFFTWKLCILLVALASPGLGYDTSTSLLFSHQGSQHSVSESLSLTPHRWFNLVRWDAIYFTHLAEQGHVYEQEWAFGIGISTTISWVAALLSNIVSFANERSLTLAAGLALSHLTHWMSVLQLFTLATTLEGAATSSTSLTPFYAAALHIFSPAGVFLSAPATESLFAFLSISGFLGYVRAVHHFARESLLAGCINMTGAAIAFSMATFVRSNGVLAGMPFAFEAIMTTHAVVRHGLSWPRISRLASALVGGLLVAAGMATPQIIAYREYCNGREPGERRPWCNSMFPSIFTWVQSHYWNVGPFRYWTLSNLPLFLLAAPTLWLLFYSAMDVLRDPTSVLAASPRTPSRTVTVQQWRIVVSLALPQLVLAMLALTSYHVQIITRISSGYPWWYIWLAAKTQEVPMRTGPIIRWMVIYALIQAGLYASFLPPA